MEKITVAIVIIDYNGKNDTIECVNSINRFLSTDEEVLYDVFILDNGSFYALRPEEITQTSLKITLLKSDVNLGFAGGNNYIIDYIKTNHLKYDYFFLLNNDTVLVDDSLHNLVLKSKERKFDITGVVNYYYSNPEEVWQAGDFFSSYSIKGKMVDGYEDNHGDFVQVDVIPGSSMLISSKVINEIGLFDERFFAYYEEWDFCATAKEHSYKVAFLSNTKLLHKVGKSSPSRLKHYLRSRNTLLFYQKHNKNALIIAYLKIIARTLREEIKNGFKVDYFKPLLVGIKDYNRGEFYKGSIDKFFLKK